TSLFTDLQIEHQASTLYNQTPAVRNAAAPPDASQRKPQRVIKDPFSNFSAVTVDLVRDEVVVADESLQQLVVYDRLATTPPAASFTPPKRVIGGLKTDIEYPSQLYLDPGNGDVYAAENDTHDRVVIFS